MTSVAGMGVSWRAAWAVSAAREVAAAVAAVNRDASQRVVRQGRRRRRRVLAADKRLTLRIAEVPIDVVRMEEPDWRWAVFVMEVLRIWIQAGLVRMLGWDPSRRRW